MFNDKFKNFRMKSFYCLPLFRMKKSIQIDEIAWNFVGSNIVIVGKRTCAQNFSQQVKSIYQKKLH